MVENRSQEPYYDDVIDLRELVKILLTYKWIIISVTLLAAAVTYLISSFLIKPTYTASAYITISEPAFRAELDSDIQVSLIMPDTQNLAELAEADAIRDQALDRLPINQENETITMEASLRGKSQLRLQVTTTDPDQAAQTANLWADVMVNRLNDLYGIGTNSVALLEAEVQKANERWNTAQSNLESVLPQSQVEVLKIQLSKAKDELSLYLSEIVDNKLLVFDGKTFKTQLYDQNEQEPLTIGDMLSLIALQQRVSGDSSSTQIQLQIQIQIQSDQLSGQGTLIKDGIEIIERLVSSVEGQNNALQAILPEMEMRIIELSKDLKNEQFKIDQLTQDRDIARSAYKALANQLEETNIIQAQNEHIAKVAVYAVSPDHKVSPQIAQNMLFAGLITGLILSAGLLFFEWWNE